MPIKKGNKQRLSREQWLDIALETLSAGGKSKFNLDTLLAAMPVSKGSFYWHFRNREEFLLALVAYWDRIDTQVAVAALSSLPSNVSPEDRLWTLMLAIHEQQLNRHDLLMRSIALEFNVVREAVAAVDRTRYANVSAIFRDMGFRGEELKARSLAFVTTSSLERAIFIDLSDAQRRRLLKQRHRLFVTR